MGAKRVSLKSKFQKLDVSQAFPELIQSLEDKFTKHL